MIAFLTPIEHKGLKIPLDKAIVFIGRHPECDIVLTRSRKVSRKHCAIAQVNNNFVIRDLGSMNGIRVNGQPIRKDVQLNIGDEVVIGDLRYALSLEKAPVQEKRADRNHVEDARAAGATRPPDSARTLEPEDYSREVPVIVPEFETFAEDSSEGDTPQTGLPVDKIGFRNPPIPDNPPGAARPARCGRSPSPVQSARAR
jgi:predicted component of type VI protein secretion system